MLEEHDGYHQQQQKRNGNGGRDPPVAVTQELHTQEPSDNKRVRCAQQRRDHHRAHGRHAQPDQEAEHTLPAEEPIEPLLQVDALTIEVGYDLVELAGSEKPGGLLERIRGIRRQIAMDMGIVVPPVRVRDNLRLGPNEYQILLRGAEVGQARLPRGRVLAIDPIEATTGAGVGI